MWRPLLCTVLGTYVCYSDLARSGLVCLTALSREEATLRGLMASVEAVSSVRVDMPVTGPSAWLETHSYWHSVGVEPTLSNCIYLKSLRLYLLTSELVLQLVECNF